jgi:hypothetical protein
MKALIRSGIVIALGCLANAAGAQEVPIKWQAVTPKTSVPTAAPAPSDSAVRPIGLSVPQPLGSAGPAGFAPIVRGQAGDDKTVPPVPKLEVVVDPKTEQKPAKKLPSDKEFTPPPPKPAPSPIYSSLMPGDLTDCGGCGGCASDCCRSWRPHWFAGHGCCNDACCSDRAGIWFTAEYLAWWQRHQSTPPLVAGSPANADPTTIGVIPGATVLYNSVPESVHNGGRFALGFWFPHCCDLGFEVNYLFLGRQTTSTTFDANSGFLLGRPVFDGVPNAEVFLANDRTGSANIFTSTQLWSIEANFRLKWLSGCGWWIDGLAGYRHITLEESLNINESLTITAPGPNLGTSFSEFESFRTRNLFNGGQIGLEGEHQIWNRWFCGWNAKLALGDMHQIIDIDGFTTRSLNGGPAQTMPGALLVSPTNRGHFTTDHFAAVPEIGFKLGFDITDHLRVFVGYDVLYLSSVVRPGDQIQPLVNENNRPFTGNTTVSPPFVPAVPFRATNFWAQGVNFGLMYRY